MTLWLLCCVCGIGAQEVDFPYPDIPDEVEEPEARMAYMLNHFWQHYTFSDSTEANQQVGEQGVVDFLNLMQHADSLTAAQGAAVLADSLAANTDVFPFFTDVLERYLTDPESPLRDDKVYAHMLRALPQTPQREWLLRRVAKNQVGSYAADILVTLDDGRSCSLHKVESELTLIVFFDPDCERCHALDAQLKQEPLIQQNPRLRVVRKNVNDLGEEYYIPHTPTLYLLDADKRVVLKDPLPQTLLQWLQ